MYVKKILLVLLLASVALAMSCRDEENEMVILGRASSEIKRRLTVNASRNAFPSYLKTTGTALTTRALSARTTLMKPPTW